MSPGVLLAPGSQWFRGFLSQRLRSSPHVSSPTLVNLPFLNLSNPFWNLFLYLGFTTSGGDEPCGLMMCCLEKKAPFSECLAFIAFFFNAAPGLSQQV